MIQKVTNPHIVGPLLKNWQESVIWSALQGVMGDIYVPIEDDNEQNNPRSAMVVLGDFNYYAGEPNRELAMYRPENSNQKFWIMVPENREWEPVIEECYKEHAKKISRFAIDKNGCRYSVQGEQNISGELHFDTSNFRREVLQQAICGIPKEYQLKPIDRELYEKCLEQEWSRDFVANYSDYAMYERLGLGVVLVEDGEIVAGASSYSSFRGGIEIEIVTREDKRRQGLAYICASGLILKCLDRGLYPSWDARTMISVALAEKLGYKYSHEYVAYDIVF